MTYSKFANELLTPYGGTKKHNLNSVLKLKNKNNDVVDISIPANYYDIESFTKILKKPDEKFSSFSLNVESLQSKFDSIKALLETLSKSNCFIDALLLQETWLSDDQCTEKEIKIFNIPGYHTIPLGRKCGRKGGLIIYLKDSFTYEVRDLYKASNIWEGIFIDITHKNGIPLPEKVTLSNIYRPPRNKKASVKSFLDALKDIAIKLANEKSTIITGGDCNINLLKISTNPSFQEFYDIFVSNGSFPMITLPTRFCKTAATLIDQIYCRFTKYTSLHKSGILVTKISDHLPCFSIINYKTKSNAKPKFVTVCKKGPSEVENFKQEVMNNLPSVYFDKNPLSDPTNNYMKLLQVIQGAKAAAFPEKTVKFNKYKHKISPWITGGILESIKVRDQLYVKMTSTSSESAKYKELQSKLADHCKILQRTMRCAKREHYAKEFNHFKSDIKKTWGKINEILSRNRTSTELPSYFCVNGSIISNNQDIANCFNNFFSGIGPALAETIRGPPNKSYNDYLKQTILTTFAFDTVCPDQVTKYINELKSKSSSGQDGISSIMLKHIAKIISPSLCFIINQSLITGIVPDSMKTAKISPIFKKDDPHLTDNYRPISLLPIISKVLEKVVFKQVYEYFSRNKLLYKNQYGFRKKHSTELAGLELNDIIVQNLERRKMPVSVFIDLSKAFDTIDHKILLKKLSYYGIKGTALKWFESYLTNRKMFVQYNDCVSSYSELTTGVPQGSILGPLLFIIYMNDIASVTDKFHFTIYADDTTLISPICTFDINLSKDYKAISANINAELQLITDWMSLNKLSLNAKKTKMMIFHYPNKHMKNVQLNLFINNTKIERVKEFNFLGVMFDENLTWKSHVSKIGSKIAAVVGTIKKLKRFLPQEILKVIYNALIQPHLNFGVLLWGTNSKRISKLQKWAVRAITNSNYNAHTNPIFNSLKLLKLHDIYRLSAAKFYYKYKKHELPGYFDNKFDEKFLNHNYPTRGKNDPIPDICKRSSSSKSMRFNLMPTVDSLPPSALVGMVNVSLQTFSKKLKQQLLDCYPTECTEINCFVCSPKNE